MATDERLGRAERDIQRLFDRQDHQDTKLETLRSDLHKRLSETEARLEQRIARNHEAEVERFTVIDSHLSAQDERLDEIASAVRSGDAETVETARREDDLIAARIDWPSPRAWLIGVLAAVVVALLLYVAHIPLP